MKTGSFPFKNKHQLIILILLAFGLNFNTLFNEYALDDFVVITENKFVEKGIGGIPELISQSYFAGCEKVNVGEFSGGRYRPFSLIIFAIEHQIFGENPFVSHLINVLIFALLIALLFRLLHSYVFRQQHPYLAFVTCLVFAVHPIHTEVIANVKSRDELITFLLLILSLTTFIRHIEKKNIYLLFTGLFCFFLALLTRESAVTFIGIVPLVLYFYLNQSIKKALVFTLPLIAILIAYMVLRVSIVGFSSSNITDIENAPFLLATASQAFATKTFILLKYIGLLFFPHPLSWDYGYNQIPYIELISLPFILSSLVMIGLFVYAIFNFKKKSIFSFCIFYFMITISLVANFVVETGTPLSERFLFQPSLAYCIAVATLYIKASEKTKIIARTILLVMLILFSLKTIIRNTDWKNSETLCLQDVISAPNSVNINTFAAEFYINKANAENNAELKNTYFRKAVFVGERALMFKPNSVIVCIDLGSAYYNLSEFLKSADLFIKGYKLMPNNPKVKQRIELISRRLYMEGYRLYLEGENPKAIIYYKKSTEANKNNIEAWYNLGGNYFIINDTKNGIEAWQNVLKLDPGHILNMESFISKKKPESNINE